MASWGTLDFYGTPRLYYCHDLDIFRQLGQTVSEPTRGLMVLILCVSSPVRLRYSDL